MAFMACLLTGRPMWMCMDVAWLKSSSGVCDRCLLPGACRVSAAASMMDDCFESQRGTMLCCKAGHGMGGQAQHNNNRRASDGRSGHCYYSL